MILTDTNRHVSNGVCAWCRIAASISVACGSFKTHINEMRGDYMFISVPILDDDSKFLGRNGRTSSRALGLAAEAQTDISWDHLALYKM